MSRRPWMASARRASDPEKSAAASFNAVSTTVATSDQKAARCFSLASAAVEAGVSRLAFTRPDLITGTSVICPGRRSEARRPSGSPIMEYLHTMVRVGNVEAALDFWCNKLGLVEVRRMENEKARYTLIFLAAPADAERAKETRSPLLELTHNWDEHKYEGGRNFGHLAYNVDDIYATCQRLL